MCGICGKIYADARRPVEERLLRDMCAVLHHRGPDDEGVHVQGNVGLGHKRLSILDLSPAGHQPMFNEDGSIWIVFNGEIYNYRELREDLEKNGHRFSSHTDTETIIHLYEEKGFNCLQDLRGMFAFALWDDRKKRLFMARDRLGKKPFVYAWNNEQFVFASELNALLQDPSLLRSIDPAAIHHYLTYSYIPSPQTIYRGIHKLPPAHYLVYKNGQVSIERYWDLSYRNKLLLPSLGDYKERFLEVLKEAVRLRLRSDVPFGAFLSGGIDSSIVVALMSEQLGQPVKTFSIGFEEQEYNELPYARMIAEQYQTEHHEFVVKPDVVDILPKLIRHYNEPYSDSSAIPTFYLAQMTRRHVTVALNGDGSDECFSGYPRHVSADALFRLQRRIGTFGKGALAALVSLLPRGRHRRSLPRRIQRYVNGFYEKPQRLYIRWLCVFDNEMKEELYTSAFCDVTRQFDSVDLLERWYDRADGEAFIDTTLYTDVMSYLPEDLLVKVDIATMAHSLEARSPFVDHKVMEFAAALPPEVKLQGRDAKYLLKQTLSDYLPPEIRHRKKMGFGVPIDLWLRNELKDMAYDILLDKTALERGYFQKTAVRQLLDDHVVGRSDHCYRIWNLLCLELWHRYSDHAGNGALY